MNGGNNVRYKVIDEWLLFNKYRVLKLNHDINCKACAKYLINGIVYEPEHLHCRPVTGTIPLDLIAIKTTESFLGSTVEFI